MVIQSRRKGRAGRRPVFYHSRDMCGDRCALLRLATICHERDVPLVEDGASTRRDPGGGAASARSAGSRFSL
jgi:hypothetical protein